MMTSVVMTSVLMTSVVMTSFVITAVVLNSPAGGETLLSRDCRLYAEKVSGVPGKCLRRMLSIKFVYCMCRKCWGYQVPYRSPTVCP